jgi:hypothetical protein
VILAKRNWRPYQESELVGSLAALALDASTKDADVSLSNQNYNYSAANVGSVRQVPGMFGGRYYVEVKVTSVGAGQQHYIGYLNGTASMTSYPGSDINGLSYRADGNRYHNGSGSTFGAAYAANDYIGLCVDSTTAALGGRETNVRVYASKNGVLQNSGNVATETGFMGSSVDLTGYQYFACGGNAAETNAGEVNFGQHPFTHAPPAEYVAPAWQRSLLLSDYRTKYQSATALASAYRHAEAADRSTDRADNVREYVSGVPTLLATDADAKTECDRWCSMYSVERFIHAFDVYLEASQVSALEPGDVIEVTYPRYGISAKKLVLLGIKGALLDRKVRITAWG